MPGGPPHDPQLWLLLQDTVNALHLAMARLSSSCTYETCPVAPYKI